LISAASSTGGVVMGVTPAVLAEEYPRLYHMAERGSWDSVKRHGLLGTEACSIYSKCAESNVSGFLLSNERNPLKLSIRCTAELSFGIRSR